MPAEKVQQSYAEITLNCAKVLSYYHVQNGVCPIKRLYLKNNGETDRANLTIKVFSVPEFLLPCEIELELFPRRSTTKFDTTAKLSPIFMLALNKKIDGEIVVQAFDEAGIVAEARAQVQLQGFSECNFEENAESIATFVKRTAEINKLLALTNQKLTAWEVPSKGVGYSGSKNAVRNFFAAAYSVVAEQKLLRCEAAPSGTVSIAAHSETLISKFATELEAALMLAAIVEANGINALVGKIAENWYVGCFLTNECLSSVVNDDTSTIRKKLENGVNDLTLIAMADIFNGISFEKAEKSANTVLKKEENTLFVDIKRARIMHIFPLPERIKKDGGFDLSWSRDFSTADAPKQIKVYSADLTGEKEISRVTQWERKLLDMDMRNSLLNFKVSQTAVKLLTPSLEDLLENVGENKSYELASKPKDVVGDFDKLANGFERNNFLKPFQDYILYEYKNKRLRSVFDAREHDSTLLRLFRKEMSVQEETGTMTLYLAVGFLKWRENEEAEIKYAPIFLYPVTLVKKGVAGITFSIDVNNEEVHVNSTLLEFLYQEFNLDIRGLADASLSSPKDILSVAARIKREIVGFKGWEFMDNAFIASLSFANYQLWHDVKYRTDKFREHPVIRSLINNRLELDTSKYEMSNKCSDEAYNGKEPLYLPISADSSQYSAIYDSLSKSFVLHGPPGTGKSQTITNIIANNIVRGRRVLFVAEKMAALSVVHKRLQNIGLGDFCLELHSNKTNKNTILNQIIKTLSLVDNVKDEEENKTTDISACIEKLNRELSAMHKKRYLGFSLYDAILNYFENEDAPDCLHIDSLFYEKLTATSFNNYLDVLTELALRAKECGDIDKSPFKHIGVFEYTETWRTSGETVVEIYLIELRHLRQYAKTLLPLFDMRTVAITRAKLDALYNIAKLLKSNNVISYFKNCRGADGAHGIAESFAEANKKNTILMTEYLRKYGAYPTAVNIDDVLESEKTGDVCRSVKRIFPQNIEKQERTQFIEFLAKCELNKAVLLRRTNELSKIFELPSASIPAVSECCGKVLSLYQSAAKLYANFDEAVFEDCCISLVRNEQNLFLDYYIEASDSADKAKHSFDKIFRTDGAFGSEDLSGIIEYVSNIQKNIDAIPSWCKYQEIFNKCKSNGFEFILEPLNVGEITANDILRCFKKCVYHNFIRSELYLDDVLCQFSGLNMEETGMRFKTLSEEYERLTKQTLYNKLVSSLPRTDTAGEHNLERVLLMRAEKTNMKGTTLRNLFLQVPSLMKATCPCMLMSPSSVSQFLDIDMEKFDLVVFDEASQVPTSKAIGSIVRGKDLIVVGDPKQLPPTTFFTSDFKEDEHFDVEDLESILDDCLAIGMPENHLLWHYRSNHESLIAFSNAMYYDNTLLTFPSPNEMNSKVSFKYVDGVYERGGSKCNKKEADELISEVINRLKNATTRAQSIGIVTFNTAQQMYIENALSTILHQNNLENAAFAVDEPLFVKNLENVQGDERDVILFSVGYGPDANGKLSLNFGPINQSGGYKRLNVAVTRARMEMRVFSSITGNMIDLSRTESKGVAGLKAFLEYAERGREMLAINSQDIATGARGIGALIAAGLKERGILCEYNVGVSNFKIDVAVVDPRDKDKYILAILCDSENACKLKGVKDRVAMQTKILKKLGWNTYQLWTINYFNNPKREITKIKDQISSITEKKIMNKKKLTEITNKYKVPYKSFYAKPNTKFNADFVLDFVNEDSITSRIRDIVEMESPIEERYLLDKLCAIYNIAKTSKKAIAALSEYMHTLQSFEQQFEDKLFYVNKPTETFRPSDTKVTRDILKIHPDEIVAAARCAVETKLNLTRDDIAKEVAFVFGITKKSKQASDWIESAISTAFKDNRLFLTIDGIITT